MPMQTININKKYVGDSLVKGVPKFDIILNVALEANSKFTINDIDKAIYILPANSFKEPARLVTTRTNNFKFTIESVKKPFDMDALIYVDINQKETKVIRRQLEIDLSLDNAEKQNSG